MFELKGGYELVELEYPIQADIRNLVFLVFGTL
jgi:hypothetical protein